MCALIQYAWCPYKKRKLPQPVKTETHREMSHTVTVEAESRDTGLPAKDTKVAIHQHKLEKARKDSTQSLRGSLALLTPSFRTSVFQNCERMHIGSFKPPSLWYSSQRPKETTTTPHINIHSRGIKQITHTLILTTETNI